MLHFERRLHHAGHYIGWAADIERRLVEHQRGAGGRLPAAVARLGIGWQVAAIFPGADRHFERRLHRRKDTPRWCPLCRAA